MAEEDNEDFEEERKEELREFLKEAEGEMDFSDENEQDEERAISLTSKEYETFQEEEEKHTEKSIYEKLCNFSRKLVEIEPSDEKRKDMQRAINFAHLEITPEGAYSFALLSGMGLAILSLILLVIGISGMVFTAFLMFLSIVAIYLLVEFPESQARLFRVKASNEIILAVIYIVIYMRFTPNLEGAIRFAAKHLEGPLSLDFKKLLWDVETRNYNSMDAALVDYMEKWKDNESFVETFEIIKNSMEQAEEKRRSMLDEAVNTMMTGSRKRMEQYSNKLELPIMVIHALGIMLPIMVLVMFPMIILLMKESVKPAFLVIGYNIILPIVIYLVSKRTLEYRPVGFSSRDISDHPEYTEHGKISLWGKDRKIWPVSVIISTVIILLGFFIMGSAGEGMFAQLSTSLIITWGIALGPVSYFFMDLKDKEGIRERLETLESEFSETLFSLGNRLSLGKPIEGAMKDAAKKNEELEISNLFKKTLRNIEDGGMSLKNALFDKDFGSAWEYPSNLIHSVLKVIIRSADKDIEIASLTSISISKYIKRMKSVEDDLKDSLSSETTSMEFLGSFLGPLIAGISVTMAAIMMSIFQEMGAQLENIQAADGTAGVAGMGLDGLMIGGWGSMQEVFPISWFQIVVGIYVIQVSYLLSMLSSGVENGPNDKVAKRKTAAVIILIGILVYSFSMLLTWQIFGGQIEALFAGGMQG